jgi:hypothetical protein
MENDKLCIKEDVCDMAVCDGVSSCSHAVLKSAVLAQQTNNTGSPKLPSIEELESFCHQQYISSLDGRSVFNWLARQLRAGT